MMQTSKRIPLLTISFISSFDSHLMLDANPIRISRVVIVEVRHDKVTVHNHGIPRQVAEFPHGHIKLWDGVSFAIILAGATASRSVDHLMIQRSDGGYTDTDEGNGEFDSRPDDERNGVLCSSQSVSGHGRQPHQNGPTCEVVVGQSAQLNRADNPADTGSVNRY